ncbi:MAG: zinc ribbon domain-containing protein [bacterium]|nr:zinc ribbon domain-containing protein [bacterium]
MPTYEYECTRCETVQELFQSITEKPKRRLKCDVCGERTPVRRLLGSGAGIVFKGSGFYATDYRSEGYKKDAKADQPQKDSKGDSPKSTKPSEKKTDAGPKNTSSAADS